MSFRSIALCCLFASIAVSYRITEETCGISTEEQLPFDPEVLIVNGTIAKPEAWPWQVAIYKDGEFYCGGSLISSRWIVTAAHCVTKPYQTKPSGNFKTVLGVWDRTVHEPTQVVPSIEKIFVHPGWDWTRPNDIALIKLSKKVKYTNKIQNVCLPKHSANFSGLMCTVTGWGWNNVTSKQAPGVLTPNNLYTLVTARLRQVSLPIVKQETCKKAFEKRRRVVTDTMICAGFNHGNRNACHGDSGGPLVCQQNGKWTLAGIVSWGMPDCIFYYGVYTRITSYIEWIRMTIVDNE